MIKISVTNGGPYIVENGGEAKQKTITVSSAGISEDYRDGKSFTLGDKAALCRCGKSKNAPFCDGSHKSADVDLTETATHKPLLDGAQEIVGPDVILTDNENYCAYARFCDAGERVWNEVQLSGEAHVEMAKHETFRCPGGRLQLWDAQSRDNIEPQWQAEIGFIEDPAMECSGPIMLTGDVEVISADGKPYEKRARQALCRCGNSTNKPFCDGMHASVKYRDGID